VIGKYLLIIPTQSDNILQKSLSVNESKIGNWFGYCYTQLTDVEQEVNSICTYDRRIKFNAERLKKYFRASAETKNSR
jgi:predicted transcriptional regulator